MRNFTQLLILAVVCGLTACDSLDKKPKVVITVHAQGSDMDSPKTIFRRPINGRTTVFKILPEFTQQSITGIHSFPAEDGTYGVALKLDFKGANALDLVTRMARGNILMTMVNGTVVDYVEIDKPVNDGIFTIWRGFPPELIAELEKKYPPINSVKSSSEFLDMSPSTTKEKKRAKQEAEKAAKAEAKAKREEEKKKARGEFDPEPPVGAGEPVPLSKLLNE